MEDGAGRPFLPREEWALTPRGKKPPEPLISRPRSATSPPHERYRTAWREKAERDSDMPQTFGPPARPSADEPGGLRGRFRAVSPLPLAVRLRTSRLMVSTVHAPREPCRNGKTICAGTVAWQRVRRTDHDLARIATPSPQGWTQNRQEIATASPPPRRHLAHTYAMARRNLGPP